MTTIESISFDLGDGERLLWSGAPRQGIVWRSSDIAMVPFSLLWGGFAVFWEKMALRGAPVFFALFGLPFVAVGLQMTIGRFFYDAWRRRHTYYGLTNQRAIIATRTPARTLRSYSVASLTNVVLQESANDAGSILLGPSALPSPWPRQTALFSTNIDNSFEMITDARRVFDLLREAQKDEALQLRPSA
jgi:hypothetical protein